MSPTTAPLDSAPATPSKRNAAHSGPRAVTDVSLSSSGSGFGIGVREVGYDDLNKLRFYGFGAIMMGSIRAVLYPLSVVKTRQQVSLDAVGQNPFVHLRSILQKEGFRGVYRGFAIVSVSTVPAQLLYVTSFEWMKQRLQNTPLAPWRNFIAGLLSSVVSNTITTPMDVISQRQMVVESEVGTRLTSGVEMARRIVGVHGLRGLYRGYLVSVLTYGPSSAVWWTTYGLIRPRLFALMPDPPPLPLALAACAVCGAGAGLAAALVTNPLDVARTRLQVLEQQRRRTFVGVLADLMRQEGTRGLLRGVQARIANMAPSSVALSVGYEFIKMMSVSDGGRSGTGSGSSSSRDNTPTAG